MGCILSSARGDGGTGHAEGPGVFVFAPGMRVPKSSDFENALNGHVPIAIVERLAALQSRLIAMAGEESAAYKSKSKRRTATQHGGTTVADLQQALEDYLPLLLGLTKEGGQSGSELMNSVQFVWSNQEDEEQETSLSSSYYELLSLLHLMAVLELTHANVLLSPYHRAENSQERAGEVLNCKDTILQFASFCSKFVEMLIRKRYMDTRMIYSRKAAVDILLKVSGKLECAINNIMPKMSGELKGKLPADLSECILRALSLQALGQGVEIQLGLAIDNVKATLAVKRRLACEHVKYWQQAFENIQNAHVGGVWGKKHILFVNWKLMEAKAAAYYYHGLILDEGSEVDTHAKAVVCLQTAEACLKGSQKLCEDFCSESPSTRVPPLWGAMKYLSEKIPRELASKTRICKEMYRREKVPDRVADLPDFSLSLYAEEFLLPTVDPLWELQS